MRPRMRSRRRSRRGSRTVHRRSKRRFSRRSRRLSRAPFEGLKRGRPPHPHVALASKRDRVGLCGPGGWRKHRRGRCKGPGDVCSSRRRFVCSSRRPFRDGPGDGPGDGPRDGPESGARRRARRRSVSGPRGYPRDGPFRRSLSTAQCLSTALFDGGPFASPRGAPRRRPRPRGGARAAVPEMPRRGGVAEAAAWGGCLKRCS
ncbi:hypothetical protein M885DRAFT_514797 [Pelagophyceae sp. CCMP2097]|nr:hypothetical protein M885DRAFT_514797 [Pelagophyceae sp. CCMP2097]